LTAPGDYPNFGSIDDSTCFGGLQSNAGIGFSIVGDVFLKSCFVVFDLSHTSPRLGWAQRA